MADITQKLNLPADRAAEARALAVGQLHAWSQGSRADSQAGEADTAAEEHGRGPREIGDG